MSNIREKIVGLLGHIDTLSGNSGFPENLSEIGEDCSIFEETDYSDDGLKYTWVCHNNGNTALYGNGKFEGTAIDVLAAAFEANNIGLIRSIDRVVPIENETYTTLSFAIKKLMQSGYVYPKGNEQTYLMRDANTGHTKIGKTNNPKRREREHKGSNLAVSLCYVCDCNVEAVLHREYVDKRVDLEWFDLTDEDIMDICRNYNFTKYDRESE